MTYSTFFFSLVIGFSLDSILGDPSWMPHPIRLFGKTIGFFENKLNRGNRLKLNGIASVLILVGSVYVLVMLIQNLICGNAVILVAFLSVGLYFFIANRSLVHESWLVMKALKKGTLDDARYQLSRIVGRETKSLSEQQIRTAVLETMSENLSDAVVAPLFWYGIGGLPAMSAYKMANTLDSMIGYKDERYLRFGWAAARLDDVLNFIPARITAIMIAVLCASPRSLSFIVRYGRKHASPNSGYPEAAMAGVLNCRFGGPNVYHGIVVDKPFIGSNIRELSDSDFYKVALINYCVSICFIGSMLLIGWLL